MRYEDIPADVLQEATGAVAAEVGPDRSGNVTIVRKPFHRIDERARETLRRLMLVVRPAGSRNALLAHVWETYPALLPPREERRAGTWELRHIRVRPDQLALWYNQLDASLHRRLPEERIIPVLYGPGEDGEQTIWMSTSDLELATMADALEECAGDVLVAGLGLGIFPTLAMRKPDVTSVTVVEIAPHIMAISADYVAQAGVTVVHDSIEDFAAARRNDAPEFDHCFYDIWPFIQDPYEHEDEARETVQPLMREAGRVTMWCQRLNDRKRGSIDRILRLGAGAMADARPDETCYSCGDELHYTIADMCLTCALGTWNESPHLSGIDFPIRPDQIPGVVTMREAQRALAALNPALIELMARRAAA